MKPRIAIAVFASVALAAGGAVATCPPQPNKVHADKSRARTHGCVDLNVVPQIGAQIVAREPAPKKPPPSYAPAAPTRYEGPTVGLTKPEPGVRPAPTIGYKWNLE